MSDYVQTRPRLKPVEILASPVARFSTLSKRWGLIKLLLHALVLVFTVAVIRIAVEPGGEAAVGENTIWLIPPLVLAILALRGTYRRSIQLDVAGELLHVVSATSLAVVLVLAGVTLLNNPSNPAPILIRAWIFTTALLCASVPLRVSLERHARRTGVASRPTLVVGAGQVGTQIERRLAEQPELGLQVVGYIDADPVPWNRVPDRQAPILGPPDEFAAIAEETGAEHVILTFTSSPDHVLVPLIRACEERGIYVSLVPRMFESINLRLSLENIGPLPLFSLSWVDPKGWQFAIKHVIDHIVGGLLLVLLSPLLLAIAIAVRVSSPGPILFRQRRIGRDGRRFDILKFRSMRMEASPDPSGCVQPGLAPGGVEGEDRRTSVGSFIRRFSLDELPQLFNVLRGQMSLIGPRPERPEFVEMFDEQVRRYSDRHRVKSGITGLAQTSGFRGQTSLPERVELDNYYIQNWSMMLDLRIFIRTFRAIVRPAE
jgi:exopolysaccharide biosynthesis polyprenyl glycosylphosphotransferase